MKSDGMIVPLSVIWDEDTIFDIDKVLDIRRKASTNGGGFGIRYTCKFGNNERYLWLDGYTWFVETDNKKQ